MNTDETGTMAEGADANGQAAGILANLPDEDFREIVDGFLRNEIDRATSSALSRPPLLERTRATLESMAVSVQSQLDARAADIETLESERRGGGGLNDEQMQRFEVDYARWRASALRFRGHLRAVIAGLPSARAQVLEDAIRAHKERIGDDGDDADWDLWAVLDQPND